MHGAVKILHPLMNRKNTFWGGLKRVLVKCRLQALASHRLCLNNIPDYNMFLFAFCLSIMFQFPASIMSVLYFY